MSNASAPVRKNGSVRDSMPAFLRSMRLSGHATIISELRGTTHGN